MKKSALLMLAAASVAYGSDCCEPCEPCCVPKPKKCIDCECYTPAFYDLQCDWGAFFDIEFLYWYAGETPLSLGTKSSAQDIGDTSVSTPNTQLFLNKKWSPGFRVGIGWNSACDGWDVDLNYMWQKNTHSQSYSASNTVLPPLVGETALYIPWLNPAIGISQLLPNAPAESLKAKWQLQYNEINLELGRKYWLSKCFNIRPFVGLRGAWDKTEFNLSAAGSSTAQTLFEFSQTADYTNKWWGVGPAVGFDPTFYFSSCFALYGNFGFSGLWGRYKANGSDSNTVFGGTDSDVIVAYTTSGEYYGMQGMLDTGIGIRFEDTYCCDRYRFTLDLGWEHKWVPNHVNRLKIVGNFLVEGVTPLPSRATYVTSDDVETSLGMGGLVLRARFDF